MAAPPADRWETMNTSLNNYKKYISRKPDHFELSLIDLLYISNFKGGNAAIHLDEDEVKRRLEPLSETLKLIAASFPDGKLKTLDEEQVARLVAMVDSACLDCEHKSNGIPGFRSSYLSALLHVYFPDLIPIIDRRVLNGTGIEAKKDAQGQIKEIWTYYGELIRRLHTELNQSDNNHTLRDLDRLHFIKPI